MDFETYVIDIKKLTKALNNKDAEVFITYRGFNLGITKPWHIKCDSRKVSHETHNGAAKALYEVLKTELQNKIQSSEEQVARYKKDLSEILKAPGLENKASHEVSRSQESSFS